MLEVFKKHPIPAILPPQRPDDYRIRVKPNAICAHNRPLPQYSLAAKEFLLAEVQRLLACRFIEPSHQPDYVVPQLVPKKTGSFRIVFNFRSINEYNERSST